MQTLKEFPKIPFTIYLYEKDKEQIPEIIRQSPNKNIAFGLHIHPQNGTVKEIDDFYHYIKENNIQPLNKTPASLHGSSVSSMKEELANKLISYQAPFIRTAYNRDDQDNSSIYKQVIPKEYADIQNFNTAKHINTYNHYFVHPNEIYGPNKEQRKNLQFFNDGVGKNQ